MAYSQTPTHAVGKNGFGGLSKTWCPMNVVEMLASASMATSRTANQDAGNENQDSVQSDLQPARRPASPYTRMPDQDDDTQFDCDDQHGGSHRQSKRCEQTEVKRVRRHKKERRELQIGVRPFALSGGGVTKANVSTATALGYPVRKNDETTTRLSKIKPFACCNQDSMLFFGKRETGRSILERRLHICPWQRIVMLTLEEARRVIAAAEQKGS